MKMKLYRIYTENTGQKPEEIDKLLKAYGFNSATILYGMGIYKGQIEKSLIIEIAIDESGFLSRAQLFPILVSPGREAACRAVFGTWGFFRTMHGKTAPSCGLHSQAGVRRGVRASGSYQEGTGKSGSYGMWNHPRGHVWNVVVRPASS